MAKRNKSEFFVATQIELFLIIIFIVFTRASFIEDEKNMLLKDFEDPQKTINKLRHDLDKAQAKIDSLLSKLRFLGSEEERQRHRADSLQRELTGTGIGNCLDKKLLANIRCFPGGIFEVEILIDEEIVIYEQRVIEPHKTYHYSEADFINFGKDLLEYSKNQYPECRYSVKVYDSETLSKEEFKNYFKLTSQYFFAQIGL